MNQALLVKTHGGRCCGIRHLEGFGYHGPTLARVESLKGQKELFGRLTLEAVLTDQQLRKTGRSQVLWGQTWKDILEEEGFALVTRSFNPNSRNNINIFHRTGVAAND